ncbi:MAG: 16S rRNA (adenine(1518)-N(6)/adenine(1519)-N(6))-dimethyltransferase RsmA [Lachnoclostridium sp.]|nr:16S rRNA (adenine(1518)-N(6)/adenine(1519)-N(6))-dimethyltransferase RsmA [Lachnoclostridium sp.]MDD7520856.1 16S rRNA (adenine(1518)-N(6)/adenine(1519)-N(6))-dimethyltransferase RsmA [Lachnoclostridium sp.]
MDKADKHLVNPQNTIEILKKFDVHFQKKFGQNFLIDSHVLDKIIRAADISREDGVLEVGPGIGTMTQYLCENAGRVLCVEIDKALLPILEYTLADYDNVNVINGDILKQDIWELARKYNDGKPFKVVANLPYYITTPIIMGFLENDSPISSITVMVQKEVAERMQAEPGTKAYGALSLAVQYYSKPYLAANVPMNCFMPRPNVASAVISLERYDEPPVKTKDEKLMFELIRASFQVRRKTLWNGIKISNSLNYTREEIEKVLTDMGLDVNVRGETLNLVQFAELADRLDEL